MSALLQEVEKSLFEHELAPKGARILCAVSGGIDSMVMLELFRRLASSHAWRLEVAHFNHQLRGSSSRRDEEFVGKSARRFGFPFHAGRARVREAARAAGHSLEMAGRKHRHAFLARVAAQRRCARVALAHQLDDQIELFFLRLLRGAGNGGLAGMKWQSPSPANSGVVLIRPLLAQSRAEIEAWAEAEGITFREDASNAALDVPRNRIRHKLIPLITAWYPAARRCIARAMEIAGEEGEVAANLAQDWRRGPGSRPFASLDRAVQRRCLEQQLIQAGLDVSFELIEFLRLHPDSAINASPGRWIVRAEGGELKSVRPGAREFKTDSLILSLQTKSGRLRFGEAWIEWRVRNQVPRRWVDGRKSRREWLNLAALENGVVLRYWRPGDRYRPLGMAKSRKLQDAFVDAKVPADERRKRLMATDLDGEILWVEGLRIAERARVGPEDGKCLEWRWGRGKTSIAG